MNGGRGMTSPLFESFLHGGQFGDAELAADLMRWTEKHYVTRDAQRELSALLVRLHDDGREAAAEG